MTLYDPTVKTSPKTTVPGSRRHLSSTNSPSIVDADADAAADAAADADADTDTGKHGSRRQGGAMVLETGD